jgi:hypothetical protein
MDTDIDKSSLSRQCATIFIVPFTTKQIEGKDAYAPDAFLSNHQRTKTKMEADQPHQREHYQRKRRWKGPIEKKC